MLLILEELETSVDEMESMLNTELLSVSGDRYEIKRMGQTKPLDNEATSFSAEMTVITFDLPQDCSFH